MTSEPVQSLQFTAAACRIFTELLKQPLSLYNVTKRTDLSPSTAHGILHTGRSVGLLEFHPDDSEGRQVGTYSIKAEQRSRVAAALQAADAAYAARAAATGFRKPRLNLPRVFAPNPTGGLIT